MPIQDSDRFLIEDAGVSKKIRASVLKPEINGTYADMRMLVNTASFASRWMRAGDLQTNLATGNWMLVERNGVSYKVSADDVQAYFPSAPAGASGVIQDSHSPGTPSYGATSSVIVSVSELRAPDLGGNIASGMLNMGVPQTNVQTLELADEDNLDNWNIGDNLVMVDADTGEVAGCDPQTTTITNVTATTKNWAGFCSIAGSGWEKPPGNIFDGNEETNGGGFANSTLTFSPGTNGPRGNWLRGRFAGQFDVYVNNGSGGEVLKYSIGARTGSRVYSEVEFDQEEQVMRLSGTNGGDYPAIYFLDIGTDRRAMRLVDGDYVEVKCETAQDLQGWRYRLLSQSRGGSDIDTQSFGVDLDQNMLIMDGGAFRGTDGSSIRTDRVTATEATFVSLRSGGGAGYSGTGRYGGRDGNKITINSSNKQWVAAPSTGNFAIKNTSYLGRLRKQQPYVDENTGYLLQLEDDTNLDLMRQLDTVQNDAVITDVLKDETPPAIKVAGGSWAGRDGSTAGNTPHATNVQAECDLLTVASLPDINFADNEAINMVNTNGDRASYQPESSTIESVSELIVPAVEWADNSGTKIKAGTPFSDNSICEFFYRDDDTNDYSTTCQLFSCANENNRLYLSSNSLIWNTRDIGEWTQSMDDLISSGIYKPKRFNHFLLLRSGDTMNIFVNGRKVLNGAKMVLSSVGLVENYYFGCTRDGNPNNWGIRGVTNNYYIGPNNGRYSPNNNFVPPDLDSLSSAGAYYYWGFADGAIPSWEVNSGNTSPVVNPAFNTTEIKLTFSDPCPDLKFFSPGDKIQARNTYIDNFEWSSALSASNLQNPKLAFDGDEGTSANSGGINRAITWRPTDEMRPFVTGPGTFRAKTFFMGTDSENNYQGGHLQTSLQRIWPIRNSVELELQDGEYVIELFGSWAHSYSASISSIQMDGNYFVDRDLSDSAFVLSRDVATKTMVVKGGGWAGTDGSELGPVGYYTGVNQGVATTQSDFKLYDWAEGQETQDTLIFDYVSLHPDESTVGGQDFWTIVKQGDNSTAAWAIGMNNDRDQNTKTGQLSFMYDGRYNNGRDGINTRTDWTRIPGVRYTFKIFYDFDGGNYRANVQIYSGGLDGDLVGNYIGNLNSSHIRTVCTGPLTFGAGLIDNKNSSFFVKNVRVIKKDGSQVNYSIADADETTGATKATGPAKSGHAKADGVPERTTFRLKDSNGQWIDNTNRGSQQFFVKNDTARVSLQRYAEVYGLAGAMQEALNLGYSVDDVRDMRLMTDDQFERAIEEIGVEVDTP